MRAAIAIVLSLAAAALAAGCSCDGGPMRSDAGPADAFVPPGDSGLDAGAIDAGPIDAGSDGGQDGGPPRSGTPAAFSTAGGGTASGPGHVVRISIGAPQPIGTATGAGGTAFTGPAAAGR